MLGPDPERQEGPDDSRDRHVAPSRLPRLGTQYSQGCGAQGTSELGGCEIRRPSLGRRALPGGQGGEDGADHDRDAKGGGWPSVGLDAALDLFEETRQRTEGLVVEGGSLIGCTRSWVWLCCAGEG